MIGFTAEDSLAKIAAIIIRYERFVRMASSENGEKKG